MKQLQLKILIVLAIALASGCTLGERRDILIRHLNTTGYWVNARNAVTIAGIPQSEVNRLGIRLPDTCLELFLARQDGCKAYAFTPETNEVLWRLDWRMIGNDSVSIFLGREEDEFLRFAVPINYDTLLIPCGKSTVEGLISSLRSDSLTQAEALTLVRGCEPGDFYRIFIRDFNFRPVTERFFLPLDSGSTSWRELQRLLP